LRLPATPKVPVAALAARMEYLCFLVTPMGPVNAEVCAQGFRK
jgi:hypothetical protein